MNNKRNVRIKVPVLARVEGEGSLEITIDDHKISHASLNIFEPPRLFEKLLEDREYHEVPDIVARICGICPVAYQMSAVQALEQIFKYKPDPWVLQMRRVFYCGEWIQSHALHIHLLAAPDLLGYPNTPAMSQAHPELIRRGLRLQALGNEIIALLGARSVHPVGARAGGFHHAPAYDDVAKLISKLKAAQVDSRSLLEWVVSIQLPEDQQEFTSVSLQHTTDYPMNNGNLISSEGLNISIDEFDQYFKEFQVPHSTALHCLLNNKPYLVGPLARMNLNHHQINEDVVKFLENAGIHFPSNNMFHSIIARAIEIDFAINESLQILENYHLPEVSFTEVQPASGVGFGCTEAPRGFLWHRYETDDSGNIKNARIVPPTSQNQARMELDIKNALQNFGLDHSESELRLHAETVIRNYDPCISCATHFLKLNVKRHA